VSKEFIIIKAINHLIGKIKKTI